MTFGEKLKELRKKKKITIKQLSEKSGLSIVSISFYENDKKKPNLSNVQKLSFGLGCDFEELYKVWKN